MRRVVMMGIAGAAIALGTGCGSKTRVPPRIDLSQHEILGIIQFSSSKEGELGPLATRRFVEEARRDQGLIRLIELGSEQELLGQLGVARLDAAAYQEIGRRFGVANVFTGELIVSDARPAFRVSRDLRNMGMSADIDATLSVGIVETASGASIWSRSGEVTTRVGEVSMAGSRDVVFDAEDPERAYGELVDALVFSVTGDFRATWH